MAENDKDIDQITSGWLKKLKPDDPSEDFSRNVMRSVYALQNQKVDKPFNFWWLLVLIPVLAAGIWYLSTIPAFTDKLNDIVATLQNRYNSLNSGFGEFFLRWKKVTISPIVILIFLAALSLLVIEDIFRKNRHRQSSVLR